MRLGWGIVATGRIARTVGSVIANHPRMRVAAIASRALASATELAGQLHAPGVYDSVAALVADPAVQAVYVASPHAQHADAVELALAAGKSVLCEKPLTADLAATERLIEKARASGTFCMEAMWMRFNPLVVAMTDLVAQGEIGQVRSLHASFGFAAPYDPRSRLWAPELGGGALLDIGIYPVDLARLLLGTPDRIAVTGCRAPSGVDAEAGLLLSWDGGARALLDISLRYNLPNTAVVNGTRGRVELGPAFHAPTQLVVQVSGREPRVRHIGHRNAGYVAELEEVERCLAEGLTESPVMPLAESLATMRVLAEAASSIA